MHNYFNDSVIYAKITAFLLCESSEIKLMEENLNIADIWCALTTGCSEILYCM